MALILAIPSPLYIRVVIALYTTVWASLTILIPDTVTIGASLRQEL